MKMVSELGKFDEYRMPETKRIINIKARIIPREKHISICSSVMPQDGIRGTKSEQPGHHRWRSVQMVLKF
jgi:hypothetical protein